MSGPIVLSLYVLLTVAIVVGIFLRASAKQRLIKVASAYFSTSPMSERWAAADRGLWAYLGDVPCLTLIRKNIGIVPENVRDAYKRYVIVSRFAYAAIGLMLLCAAVGYRFSR
jgi:hypothetical protein